MYWIFHTKRKKRRKKYIVFDIQDTEQQNMNVDLEHPRHWFSSRYTLQVTSLVFLFWSIPLMYNMISLQWWPTLWWRTCNATGNVYAVHTVSHFFLFQFIMVVMIRAILKKQHLVKCTYCREITGTNGIMSISMFFVNYEIMIIIVHDVLMWYLLFDH